MRLHPPKALLCLAALTLCACGGNASSSTDTPVNATHGSPNGAASGGVSAPGAIPAGGPWIKLHVGDAINTTKRPHRDVSPEELASLNERLRDLGEGFVVNPGTEVLREAILMTADDFVQLQSPAQVAEFLDHNHCEIAESEKGLYARKHLFSRDRQLKGEFIVSAGEPVVAKETAQVDEAGNGPVSQVMRRDYEVRTRKGGGALRAQISCFTVIRSEGTTEAERNHEAYLASHPFAPLVAEFSPGTTTEDLF